MTANRRVRRKNLLVCYLCNTPLLRLVLPVIPGSTTRSDSFYVIGRRIVCADCREVVTMLRADQSASDYVPLTAEG